MKNHAEMFHSKGNFPILILIDGNGLDFDVSVLFSHRSFESDLFHITVKNPVRCDRCSPRAVPRRLEPVGLETPLARANAGAPAAQPQPIKGQSLLSLCPGHAGIARGSEGF